MDPWMSWIHRWPRTDPSPSLGPPEAANGLRGPWDLRRLPGPNSLFECYVRVARPWCCWGRGWFAWYLWRWCGSRHDKFRVLKFYLVRLFGLLRPFRFRFFPTGRPPLLLHTTASTGRLSTSAIMARPMQRERPIRSAGPLAMRRRRVSKVGWRRGMRWGILQNTKS